MAFSIFKSVTRVSASIAILGGLLMAPAAFAASTTLTFEELSQGTAVDAFYSPQGAIFMDAVAATAASSQLPPHNDTMLAFSETGNMTVNFTITNINKVSAFVSGAPGTTLTAYDADGNSIGQSISGGGNNVLLSVGPTGTAVAGVNISGDSFIGVDDFTFETPAPTPTPTPTPAPTPKPTPTPTPVNVCVNLGQKLSYEAANLSVWSFRNVFRAPSQIQDLKQDVAKLQSLIKLNASKKQILAQIYLLKDEINYYMRRSNDRSDMLYILDMMIVKIKSGKC